MAKKLYVGNLPYSTTEQELRDMFAEVGEVSDVALITDQYSGQSKGFAFVEMTNDDAAQQAIAKYDGTTMGNRQIVVNEARPREDRGGRGGGGRYGGGGGGGYDRRGGGGGGGRDRY